ncbi:alanine racemase [[Limnothrix rosea] IAM M-220]|uniref:alanine racemase n=1 Tax=[Limnothrix rosea] IAM M-220 TaxID=454133 RepID=UPI0009690B8A|nr:alanine racemase [[Limnothrix rosea] IAM M-220]OKH19256.1 alanine racemase [[Limnothrix rosea] IAM M-220]
MLERQKFSDSVAQQRAWVEIDHKALAHNIRALKSLLAPTTELLAVVKANAYGHGVIEVTKTVLENGATWLAIATLGEGIEIREAGITAPILVLGATNTAAELEAIAHWDLQPTLCTLEQQKLFQETMKKLGKTLPVHLEIDTGMSRLGTRWEGAVEFVEAVHTSENLEIASIYSHFATADEVDLTMTHLQHERFKTTLTEIGKLGIPLPKLHLCNSAGTMLGQEFHYDMVRPGIAIYGCYPAPHMENVVALKPVMQVKARITQVKTLPPDTGVSYGHRFVTSQKTKIAVVGIGYADGIPRCLSNNLKVFVNGQLAPQLGSVTMDQIMLDVSHIENVQAGDIVTLIGKEGGDRLTVDQWANQLGTISYEILCGFKPRLPRIHL